MSFICLPVETYHWPNLSFCSVKWFVECFWTLNKEAIYRMLNKNARVKKTWQISVSPSVFYTRQKTYLSSVLF
jgi:hypothetical protein